MKTYKEWLNESAEYQGRKVTLDKPRASDNPKKKYMVYEKNDKGNVVKVYFGDPSMEIRRDNPDRRKAFRSRHSCDDDKPNRWEPRYWACKFWDKKPIKDLLESLIDYEDLIYSNPEIKLKDGTVAKIDSRIGKMDYDRFEGCEYSDVIYFTVYIGDKQVAWIEYYVDWTTVENIEVKEEHKRLGIATAVYNFIEDYFKIKLLRSTQQEQEGKLFWKSRGNK